MTIQTANAIVQRLGPCRVVLDQTANPELACELALMGCELADPARGGAKAEHGTTAGFVALPNGVPATLLASALHPFQDLDMLVLQSAGQDRRVIERTLFHAGWQRHPGGMMAGEYPAWSETLLPAISYYQRATQDGTSWLGQGGIEADAMIARYAMAANLVRPGDHVLIDGEGSADGASILTALSRAGSIDRVGAKPADDGPSDVTEPALGSIDDNRIDLIIAFEPTVPTDWVARLEDFARVLKHDGRIILGWKRRDGDNRRPRDWDALTEAVSEHFLPETRYVQVPVGQNPAGPYGIFPVDVDESEPTDWLMIVASANPLLGEGHGADYDHPAFPKARGPMPALVDFGAAYDNPYLYRTMVQMGERLGHDMKLARLAECVIEDSRADSADRGAAIAVLGYRILELRRLDLAAAILPLILDYVDRPLADDTPVHVRRWRISLAFLGGKLNELTGERDAAKRWYRVATDGDWEHFSPLLATKAIAAAFFEARMHLADGDGASALACFRQGFDTALKAAAFPHERQASAGDRPLPFYLQELAEVIDMGSQCANAITHFHLWQRDPGLFWRQVDIRRFGLASWARDLERENHRLRAA